MFYFRINKVRVLDNRERGSLFGLLRPDRAEVTFISLMTTDNDTFPDLDLLRQTPDPAEQDRILHHWMQQVASLREISPVYAVRDGQVFTFGDTGYVLFQSEQTPKDFNWVFMALELDQDIRDLEQRVAEALTHPAFPAFKQGILSTLSMAGLGNPALAVGLATSKFLAGLWMEKQSQNTDDQIGLLYTSFNKPEHYPHGHRDRQDVADLTNNMFVDYTIFAVEEKQRRKKKKTAPEPALES